MGLLNTDLHIFHGTKAAYDRILLPGDVGFITETGQASGAAFYTFATTDPSQIEIARDNARVFADDGMVLSGVSKAGAVRLIDGREPIGAELASQFKQQLLSIDTGNELLDRYYRSLAETITPEQNGTRLWGNIHGNQDIQEWLKLEAVKSLGDIPKILKEDRRSLNAALEGRGIEGGISGCDNFTPEQRVIIGEELKSLAQSRPEYAAYYTELAEGIESGKIKTAGFLFEELSRPEFAKFATRKFALQNADLPHPSVYEAQWHKIIDNLDIAGIYYHQKTGDVAIFQGDKGIRQLPELKVEEMLGGGPRDLRADKAKPLAVGDVAIRPGGGRLEVEGQPTVTQAAPATEHSISKPAATAQSAGEVEHSSRASGTPTNTGITTQTPPPQQAPEAPTTPAGGAQALAAAGQATSGPEASNNSTLQKGHAETLDHGNLAVKPQAAPAPAAPPQLQSGQTTNVAAGHPPAANDPTPKPQKAQTGNVGAGRPSAANDAPAPKPAVPAAAPAHPQAAQQSTPTKPAEAHAPVSGGKAGMATAAKGTGYIAAGVAVGTGVYTVGKEVFHGATVGDALKKGGEAGFKALPVVGALSEGRFAEAAAQAVGVGLGVAAGAITVSTAGAGAASFVGAAAIEDGMRKAMRAAGLQVDDGLLANMAKATAAAIEKTIPASVMQANMNMLRVQENLLKDAGLGAVDARGKTAADYLRDPATRDAYLATLKESLKTEKDPKALEAIHNMVEAAEKFCEIEGRRVAKLSPHMKEVETKLAETLKAQHLATQFKQENPGAGQYAHGGQAAGSPAAPPAAKSAAQSRG